MPKFPSIQPRHRRDWRVATTAVAAVALVGGAAAVAPHLAAHGATTRAQQAAYTQYDGSVAPVLSSNPNAANATASVYDYQPGTGTPDTGLSQLGTLPEGAQVSIQCYWTGAPAVGPQAQGPGGTDVYWDQIVGASTGMSFTVPAGDVAVMPDAVIDTGNKTVDQLVPACGSGSGQSAPPAAGSGSPPAGSSGSGAAGTVGGVPPASASSPCTDVEVVFARGTGETQDHNMGLGDPGGDPRGGFVPALHSALPGKTISYHAVQYPADVTQSSVPQGADDMTNWVTSEAARCPSTKFVLGGYSQGASVVDLALGLGPTVAKAYVAAAAAPVVIAAAIDPVIGFAGAGAAATLAGSAAVYQGRLGSLSGRIAAVVTFGNPIHWSGEDPQAASPDYAQKWSDFCNYSDPVCDSLPPLSRSSLSSFLSDPLAAHKQYHTNGSATSAAEFAASMVNAAG